MKTIRRFRLTSRRYAAGRSKSSAGSRCSRISRSFASNGSARSSLNAWKPEDGPAPGEYAKSLNGYLLPIAMEVRRGRYNKSYAQPEPLVANQPTEFTIPLRDHDHVFLKGHRLMVQVQSTWFPVIDRNPQTYVSSIYVAKASDFVTATQRVYSTPKMPSHIVLSLMP